MTKLAFNRKDSCIILFFMLIFIAVVAKIYQYNFAEERNFTIMNFILDGINYGKMMGSTSFDFPIRVYSCFKWLGITTNLGWSIFWCGIGNIIIYLFFVLKKIKLSIIQIVFIAMSMFILDFMVFNANKDMIQFLFVVLCYVIVTNGLLKDWIKVILVSLVLLFEAYSFRSYYVITFGMFIVIYLLYIMFMNRKTKPKHFAIKFISLVLLSFFLIVFAASIVSHDMYEELVFRRDSLENLESNTTILNLIDGESFVSFVMNYLINAIRMCFPIEILTNGITNMAFSIYQICLSVFFISKMRYMNRKNLLVFAFVFAFMLTMFAAESDFGTLTRHQSIIFFFVIELQLSTNKEEIVCKSELAG